MLVCLRNRSGIKFGDGFDCLGLETQNLGLGLILSREVLWGFFFVCH